MALAAKGKRSRRIFLILLILWVSFHFGKNALDNYKLRRKIADLENYLQVLELRGEELKREIAQWSSPENIERVAREELGLVKPGEVVYTLSETVENDVERDVEKRSRE